MDNESNEFRDIDIDASPDASVGCLAILPMGAAAVAALWAAGRIALFLALGCGFGFGRAWNADIFIVEARRGHAWVMSNGEKWPNGETVVFLWHAPLFVAGFLSVRWMHGPLQRRAERRFQKALAAEKDRSKQHCQVKCPHCRHEFTTPKSPVERLPCRHCRRMIEVESFSQALRFPEWQRWQPREFLATLLAASALFAVAWGVGRATDSVVAGWAAFMALSYAVAWLLPERLHRRAIGR